MIQTQSSLFQVIFVIGDEGIKHLFYNRFDYTYYKKEDGAIYQSIEKLDKAGAEFIEKHDTKYSLKNNHE